MDEDELELQPQEPNSFFDGLGTDATHMDGDQIVVEVQETVFVSDVVDSDITVHNFVPDDPWKSSGDALSDTCHIPHGSSDV